MKKKTKHKLEVIVYRVQSIAIYLTVLAAFDLKFETSIYITVITGILATIVQYLNRRLFSNLDSILCKAKGGPMPTSDRADRKVYCYTDNPNEIFVFGHLEDAVKFTGQRQGVKIYSYTDHIFITSEEDLSNERAKIIDMRGVSK